MTSRSEVRDLIMEAYERARGSMEHEGYIIKKDIHIALDPNLQIMGYTYYKDGLHFIVVSGFAVTSGLVDGLLVHEMCHIFRAEEKHPSHNELLVNEVMTPFRNGDYKDGIMAGVVNHVKDIYADDVGFKVFKGWNGSFSGDTIREFFLNWIKTEPIEGGDPLKTMWMNGSVLVSNAFALGSMIRHGYEEIIGREFTSKINSFLDIIGDGIAGNFEYFKDSFAHTFRVEVDESSFRDLLSEYLERFTKMVEEPSPNRWC